MNSNYAIERQRQPLIAIVASLYAMIELAEGGMIDRLRRPLHRAVLAILRPAESALRRLIVMMAHGLKAKPKVSRPAPKGLANAGKGKGRRSFALFDRRVRYDLGRGRRARGPKVEPHVWSLDDFLQGRPHFCPRPEPAPSLKPDDSVSAASLCRRLDAARRALLNLRRQAERYARWRDKPLEQRRPKLMSPLRPGPPPSLSRTSSHEVHEILRDCHALAHSLPKPDTS